MEKNFNLEIISPESILLSEKVNSVTIPSFEGEMTILADHIPLITFLRPGITKVEGSKQSQFFVEEGTVEFSNNTLITKFPIVGDIVTAGSPEDGLIGAKFKVEKIDGEYEVFYNPISVFVPNIIKNFLGD